MLVVKDVLCDITFMLKRWVLIRLFGLIFSMFAGVEQDFGLVIPRLGTATKCLVYDALVSVLVFVFV